MKSLIAFLTLSLLAAHAEAAVMTSCKGLDSIAYLSGQMRHFEHGVGVAKVEMGEPSNSVYLLVFAYGDDDYVKCTAIATKKATLEGFREVDVAGMTSTTISDKVERLDVNIQMYDEPTGKISTSTVSVTITEGYPSAQVSIDP